MKLPLYVALIDGQVHIVIDADEAFVCGCPTPEIAKQICDAVNGLALVDDVLVINWVAPPADGDYRKALYALVSVAMAEHKDPLMLTDEELTTRIEALQMEAHRRRRLQIESLIESLPPPSET